MRCIERASFSRIMKSRVDFIGNRKIGWEYKPGNPPSLFRSQSVCFNTLASFSAFPSTLLVALDFEFASVNSSTMKVPPVLGWSATSPISVPKVERSSWANCF